MNNKMTMCLSVCLLVTACAEQPTKSTSMIPVEERHVPANGNAEAQTANKVDDAEPAVIAALMNEAKTHAAGGYTDKAIATIERALRIEPRNARLWHEFATIRLQQNNWSQAIALARKSNALAVNDPELRSSNWDIIARAYEALGETDKTKEARKQQRLTG